MTDDIYRRAQELILQYTKNKIIPAIKNRMVAEGYSATGKYARSLYAETLKSASSVVKTGIYSKPRGAKFVEGKEHKIKPGTNFGGISISRLAKWARARGIHFNRIRPATSTKGRHKTDSLLNYTQTAWAIVSKYRGSGSVGGGRKARFFIDMIVNRHIKRIKNEVFETLKKESLDI